MLWMFPSFSFTPCCPAGVGWLLCEGFRLLRRRPWPWVLRVPGRFATVPGHRRRWLPSALL